MICSTCNNNQATRIKIQFINDKAVELCDRCGASQISYARDALGQRVQLPEGYQKKFSYATGTPISSNRQYSETLKRMGLAQINP